MTLVKPLIVSKYVMSRFKPFHSIDHSNIAAALSAITIQATFSCNIANLI